MYDEVYSAWKREMEEEELQPLSTDFYLRLKSYMNKLEEAYSMLNGESVKALLMRRELENLRRLTASLVDERRRKIGRAIMDGNEISVEEAPEGVVELVNRLIEAFQRIDRMVLGGDREVAIPRDGYTPVRFLKSIPKIIGSDMRTYGPFEPEDVAYLPEENAEILVEKGVAAKISRSDSKDEKQ